MPIPAFVTAGLLPVGVHDATLEEIRQRFGIQNDTRIKHFGNLKTFCEELEVFGSLIKGIFVDGSFVTDKPVPSDVDIVVVHDEDDFDALDDHVNREFLFQDRALERYKFDLFVECDEVTMVRFFQKVSTDFALGHGLPARHPKGIIRVTR
jgi:predicted nucleotidyltransferase